MALVASDSVADKQDLAVQSATEVEDIGALPDFPKILPDYIYLPFTPQISVSVAKQKVMLVLNNVNITGLNATCTHFDIKHLSNIWSCDNLTVTSGFKAGGRLFDLPVVGKGNISIHLAFILKGGDNFANFKTLNIDIQGLNPGSDIQYL